VGDPFAGVLAKVERAKNHLAELEQSIVAYMASDPYSIGTTGDPYNGPGAWIISEIREPPPVQIALIAGDAIHNARAAFDHLIWVSTSNPTQETAFPVWRNPTVPTPNSWRSTVEQRTKGVSRQLKDAIAKLQAYPGGSAQWLWELHQLDIIDKHHLVISTLSAHRQVIMSATGFLKAAFPDQADLQELPPADIAINSAEWTPIKVGSELLVIEGPEGIKYDGFFKFPIYLGLSEPQVLAGQPVMETISRIVDESERLITNLIPLA
jgi:hypothetical protein